MAVIHINTIHIPFINTQPIFKKICKSPERFNAVQCRVHIRCFPTRVLLMSVLRIRGLSKVNHSSVRFSLY